MEIFHFLLPASGILASDILTGNIFQKIDTVFLTYIPRKRNEKYEYEI